MYNGIGLAGFSFALEHIINLAFFSCMTTRYSTRGTAKGGGMAFLCTTSGSGFYQQKFRTKYKFRNNVSMTDENK